MRFSIPQFIEIEDKIFGPFTFKQFIYLVGGAGAAFLFYSIFPTFIAIPLIVLVGIFAYLLGFKPIHGRPFAIILESAFRYVLGNKLYLWRKEHGESEKLRKTEIVEPSRENVIPHVAGGKLDLLSWSLDVNEGRPIRR